MSKHGSWTIVFDDQMIIKRIGEFDKETALGYQCGGTDFWNQSKFSEIHAIQFTNDAVDNDQVEYKDSRPNSSYDANVLGDFQQFIDFWDSKHLSVLQENWDNNNVKKEITRINEITQENEIIIENETLEEKISRLGVRPTTYSS
jgi:hypothetical protein